MDAPGDFLGRYREALICLYVFADQLGVPLPAIPALLAMGAFAAAGKLHFGLAALLSVVASVLADSVWYVAGRQRGPAVLRLLCKVSLEPDSRVRRTEEVFLKYGVHSLLGGLGRWRERGFPVEPIITTTEERAWARLRQGGV